MNNKYINDKDSNLSGSFPSKTPKDLKKKSGILMALLPLSACGGGSSGGGAVTVAPPPPDYVESPTNVFVASSNVNPTLDKASSTSNITVTGNNTNDTITTGSGNDTIDAKNGTNIIKSGSGTDKITTGSGADQIRAGEGIDSVSSGGGDDVIVVVGTTTATQYTNSSITNSAGSGTNLSGLITLADLNGRTVSEIGAGETINGGTGSNTLVIYGTVDLTGVVLTNVTTLYVNSDVTLTPAQIAGFTTIDGDGNSVINIVVPSGSSDTYILDLSAMTTSGIANINISGDVTVKVSAASDLTGITAITSSNSSTVTLNVVDEGTATAISLSDIKGTFTAVDKIVMEDQVTLTLEGASDVTSLGLTKISGDGTIGSTSVQAAIDGVTISSSINFSPTGAVTIAGTATEDQVLTASNTLVDADNIVGTINYQWTRDGVNISGATSTTYTLVQADVAKAIKVVASYTDAGGALENVTSSATSAVSNVSHAVTGAVTISGTAKEDQVLTASNNLADADGLGTISYQWTRGGVNISGATNSTHTLVQADVGKAIKVVASYTDGEGTAETVTSGATSAVSNVSHAVTGAVGIDGTTTQGQILTATNNLADADGLGTIGYQWTRGGVNISGATSSTHTLVQADVGKAIKVVTSYTDGEGTVETVTSSATSNIVNINDAATGSVSISGTVTEDQVLTASNNLADADGLGTISYQWTRDGADISGATSATYTLVQTDVGAAIKVVASYTDSAGSAETVSSSATTNVANANDAATGAVSIGGTSTQGQVLTATNNLADADGLGTISYQWTRGGVNISGATSSTHTLVQADVGKAIKVVASYTDGQGTVETVTSSATSNVVNVNDAATGSVTISGITKVEQVLTASNTLADADTLGTISYQWTRNSVDISNATSSTYTLVQADVGKAIKVVASYTDGEGTAETVSSSSTPFVSTANNFSPTGSVTIAGTATEDQVLTASNTLADQDTLGTISYQWTRDGVDISGATSSTHTLVQADVGAAIKVVASYTDGEGNGEAVSSSATSAVANVSHSATGSVTISGTVTEDQVLTASNNLADADGLGTISYQWTRDGADISSATSSTYTLLQADVGKAIKVVASYTDGDGTATSVSSSATSAVVNVSHAATGSVTISGTINIGSVLTASNDLADADGLGTITYQWKRAGTDIGSATSSTYTLVQADVGKAITVVASYTDGDSKTETVASSATSNVNGTPTDLTLSASNVSHLAKGYTIGELTWYDPNTSDTGDYTVDDSRFEVVNVDGVGVLKLKNTQSLDMNTYPSVTVSVTITDAGGLSYSESFNISTIETNTPYSIANSGSVSKTNNNKIDSLLSGFKFNPDTANGPTTITYSFPSSSSYWSEDTTTGYGLPAGNSYPYDGFGELNSAAKSVFTSILGSVSNVANITFTLLNDTQTSAGQIRVSWSDGLGTNDFAGAWFPFPIEKGGDLWLHNDILSQSDTSGFFQFTLLHELGHSLGLKHPFKLYNGFPLGEAANDYHGSTVMAYTPWITQPGLANVGVTGADLYPSTFMMNDLLALQHIYGKNLTNNDSDTSYAFNTSSRYYKTIWDTGGNDTYTITGSEDVVIKLTPGSWSNVGTVITYTRPNGDKFTTKETVYIPEAVTIENASGGSGNDKLTGNTVSNILTGNAGNDILEGGAGADVLNGGDGSDYVAYRSSNAAVNVNLLTNAVSGGHAQGDTISNFERIWGSDYDDTLTGDANSNLIEGFGGSDVLNGGDGSDYLSYYNSNEGVVVKLYENTVSGGHAQGDTISNFENIYGSEFVDYLNGDNTANVIYGNKGNDYIQGLEGSDTLNGGDGFDFVLYGSSNAAVNVNLLTNAVSGGHAQGDTISNFENIYGSAYNDTLKGDNTANLIYGNNGNNLLYGEGGNDVIVGGAGIDGLSGGAGDDELYGGLNVDSFWFWGTWGDDTIKDWDDGVDKINLSNTSLSSVFITSNNSGDVVLGDDASFTNSITFYGITTGITADDIIFA